MWLLLEIAAPDRRGLRRLPPRRGARRRGDRGRLPGRLPRRHPRRRADGTAPARRRLGLRRSRASEDLRPAAHEPPSQAAARGLRDHPPRGATPTSRATPRPAPWARSTTSRSSAAGRASPAAGRPARRSGGPTAAGSSCTASRGGRRSCSPCSRLEAGRERAAGVPALRRAALRLPGGGRARGPLRGLRSGRGACRRLAHPGARGARARRRQCADNGRVGSPRRKGACPVRARSPWHLE